MEFLFFTSFLFHSILILFYYPSFFIIFSLSLHLFLLLSIQSSILSPSLSSFFLTFSYLHLLLLSLLLSLFPFSAPLFISFSLFPVPLLFPVTVPPLISYSSVSVSIPVSVRVGITNMVSDLVLITARLAQAETDLACRPVQTQWFRLVNTGTFVFCTTKHYITLLHTTLHYTTMQYKTLHYSKELYVCKNCQISLEFYSFYCISKIRFTKSSYHITPLPFFLFLSTFI